MTAAPAPKGLNPADPDSAINFLISEARLDRTKRTVVLNSGKEFSFWCKPLVAAERLRAQKDAKSDDTNEFILMLLVQKATYENGQRMFHVGHISQLKNEVREDDLQKIELAMLNNEEAEEPDPKP